MFRNQVLQLWDFIFKDFFLAPVWFYTKTSPDRNCFIVETSLYTLVEKMFTNMQIRSLILKIHLAIFNMQMQKKKSSFYENVLDFTLLSQDLELFSFFFLGLIFFRTFLWSYFLRFYWQSLSLGGKNSKFQESKTQDFFPVTFFPKTLENLNFLPKFLFPGFFSSKFFFYDSYKCPLRTIVRILEYAVNAVNINILIIYI